MRPQFEQDRELSLSPRSSDSHGRRGLSFTLKGTLSNDYGRR